MSAKKNSEGPPRERRRFQRLPVVEGMVEPITVNFEEPGDEQEEAAAGPRRRGSSARSGVGTAAPAAKNQPALLTNLSAGGMSLILFLEPPKTRRLEMVLTLPGLNHIPLEGRIMRVQQRGQTYNIGIAFTRINGKHRGQINAMAQDHLDCETRIALRLPEACVPNCTFHGLCAKPQKGLYWPK